MCTWAPNQYIFVLVPCVCARGADEGLKQKHMFLHVSMFASCLAGTSSLDIHFTACVVHGVRGGWGGGGAVSTVAIIQGLIEMEGRNLGV